MALAIQDEGPLDSSLRKRESFPDRLEASRVIPSLVIFFSLTK